MMLVQEEFPFSGLLHMREMRTMKRDNKNTVYRFSLKPGDPQVLFPNSMPLLLAPGATALTNLWHLQSALFVQLNGRSSILQVCPSSPLWY